jgi:gliding motility-associated-like protein
MKKDELEDLFKDSFENFEADVNPGVWKNIQTGLKGAGLGLIGKMLINKIGSNAIVAIVSSAAAVVGTVFVMNGTADKETKIPKTAEPKVIADTQKPTVDEIKNFLSTGNSANKETPAVKKETAPEAKAPVVKKDEKQIQKVLSELTEGRIASISSSCVGGAVPLIVSLSNIGTGKANKWTFNDGTKPMTGPDPVKYFDVPGIYTITLTSTSADGKTAVDSVKIEVTGNSSMASAPTDFSPNGDGVRDEFRFNQVNMVSLEATVVDKKGKVIYSSNSIDAKWDGKTMGGEKAKEGIYYYILSAVGVDGKKYEQKGKINLTR